MNFDPKLDLVLERTIDVPRELVWKAWTTPDHLKHWFTPAPWQTTHCEIDLRPGGIFRTVMKGPEGPEIDNSGCYLQVVENEMLVWTDGLLPGFRPKAESFMTARLTLESVPQGTKYIATVYHKNQQDREKHQQMGFEAGWGAVVDQLREYIKAKML